MMKAMNINYDMMIEENMGLVYMTINKYYSSYAENYMEELVQIGMIALFKAIKSYDESRGIKLSTLATRVIKNDLYTFVTDGIKKYNGVTDGVCTSMYASNGEDEDSNLLNLLEFEEDYSNVQTSEMIQFILTKDENTQTMVKMLVEGYSYSEIGNAIGVSKQRVGQMIKKLRKEIIENFPIDSYTLAKQIIR